MAQRQFRTDDSSNWDDRFGSGSDGSISLTTNLFSNYIAFTTFGGSGGSTSAGFGSGSGFANGDLLLIHQTRNGGVGAGAWELNKIASGGGTASVTLTYPLIQNYDTTAQVIRLKQYSSISLAGGNNLSLDQWNGSTGGIAAFICNGTTTIAGAISGSGAGFRGGGGVANNAILGDSGEGTTGPSVSQSGSANGNGGGGGKVSLGPDVGNAGNGATGSGSGNNGVAVGNAALTLMDLGGGGGGKGQDGTNISGARGSGIVVIISKIITVTGSINLRGADGGSTSSGGGAGGSALFKGQDITLGSSLVDARGNPNVAAGGNGAVGRIHVDYSSSFSGTATPGIDSSLDSVFTDPAVGGSYSFFM